MSRSKSVLHRQVNVRIQRTFACGVAICAALLYVCRPTPLSGQETHAAVAEPQTVISIIPSDKTVLMAADARMAGPLKVLWPEQAKRYWVSNWARNEDSFTWKVRVPEA